MVKTAVEMWIFVQYRVVTADGWLLENRMCADGDGPIQKSIFSDESYYVMIT
jgi:hypothetical protein